MRKKKETNLVLKCTKCNLEGNEYPLAVFPVTFRVLSQYCCHCEENTLHKVAGIILTEHRPLTERQVKNLLQKKKK